MVAAMNNAEVQCAARLLFEGCAPEQVFKLSELWDQFLPEFQLHEDNHPDGPFLFDAGAYKYIRFNNRAMRLYWLGAFIAWEAFVATPADMQTAPDWTRLKAMISVFDDIATAFDPNTVPYPDGVPTPGMYLDGNAHPEERAAAELATIASGWAMLHEFCHVQKQQNGCAADPDNEDEIRQEELICDAFAATFLTEHVKAYAALSGYSTDKIVRKRQLAIFIGLFNIALLTKANWGHTTTHPSLKARIDAIKRLFEPNCDAEAEHVASLAFQALGCLMPGAPSFT
jgi:hypothetical protein